MRPKILILLLFFAFICCETYNYNTIEYGKMGNNKKRIEQILLNDKLSKKINYDSLNRISEVINYYEGGNDTIHILYNADNQVSEIKYYRIYIEKYFYQNKILFESLTTNIQNPEWSIKLRYYNKNNRIISADKYSGENLIGKINFEYDTKGNTISRIEYSPDKVHNIDEYRYSYDDKKNPLIDFPYIPMDILQFNNAVKTFHYSMLMSSLPTEYGLTYYYDKDGFPISAKKYEMKNPNKILYSYTYIYK